MATKRCSNCGNPGFEDKAGYECRSCGFKNIPSTELPVSNLIYCEDCGNHWLDACGNGHDISKWTVVTLTKKEPVKKSKPGKDDDT